MVIVEGLSDVWFKEIGSLSGRLAKDSLTSKPIVSVDGTSNPLFASGFRCRCFSSYRFINSLNLLSLASTTLFEFSFCSEKCSTNQIFNKYWLKTMSDDAGALKLGVGQARKPLSGIAQATADFAGWGEHRGDTIYSAPAS